MTCINRYKKIVTNINTFRIFSSLSSHPFSSIPFFLPSFLYSFLRFVCPMLLLFPFSLPSFILTKYIPFPSVILFFFIFPSIPSSFLHSFTLAQHISSPHFLSPSFPLSYFKTHFPVSLHPSFLLSFLQHMFLSSLLPPSRLTPELTNLHLAHLSQTPFPSLPFPSLPFTSLPFHCLD